MTSSSTLGSMLIMISFMILVGAVRLCKRGRSAIRTSHRWLEAVIRKYVLNEPLVDPHLVAIPSLRTFTTGSLSGGDLEMLGREPDWAAHPKFVRLGTVNEFCADLLENLDLARRQPMGVMRHLMLVRELRDNMVPSMWLGHT